MIWALLQDCPLEACICQSFQMPYQNTKQKGDFFKHLPNAPQKTILSDFLNFYNFIKYLIFL